METVRRKIINKKQFRLSEVIKHNYGMDTLDNIYTDQSLVD